MTKCLHDVPMNETCKDQGCCGTQKRLEKLVCHKCEELKAELTKSQEDLKIERECSDRNANASLDLLYEVSQRADTAEAKLSDYKGMLADAEGAIADLMLVNDKAEATAQRYIEALEFYADPENYHAISFWPDSPCGGFANDFSRTDHEDYERPMPGKTARQALEPTKLQPGEQDDDDHHKDLLEYLNSMGTINDVIGAKAQTEENAP